MSVLNGPLKALPFIHWWQDARHAVTCPSGLTNMKTIHTPHSQLQKQYRINCLNRHGREAPILWKEDDPAPHWATNCASSLSYQRKKCHQPQRKIQKSLPPATSKAQCSILLGWNKCIRTQCIYPSDFTHVIAPDWHNNRASKETGP